MNSFYAKLFYFLGGALLFFAPQTSEAKVLIFSHYFDQPEFVKYQALFFEKNMLDDYEFFVFEDSRNPQVTAQIKEECRKYHAHYIQIPRSAFDEPLLPIQSAYVSKGSPSFECSIATQYIYNNYAINSQDAVLITDNDIFLLSPFSIENYIKETPFAFVPQSRGSGSNLVVYMLPNFLIFQPRYMEEKDSLCFNLGEINSHNTESGGYTHFYLKKFLKQGNEINQNYLFNIPKGSSSIKDRFGEKCPFLFNSHDWYSHFFLQIDSFLHIRMGSNWSNHPNYRKMLKEIDLLFSELLDLPREL